MPSYNIIDDLVRKALKDKPLPAEFADLPDRDQRPFIERAREEGTTPEALYALVRDKQIADLGGTDENFDPVAIARAVRSGAPFSGPSN